MSSTYQPELDHDVQQGFASLGSLFAPSSPGDLVAKQAIATSQANAAERAQKLASIGSLYGAGVAGAYGLGDLQAIAHDARYRLFQQSQDPNVTLPQLDRGNLAIGGDASKTFTQQQAAPLTENQSRILPPALAGALGVPAQQHGVVALGDNKMMPGGGQQPIAVDPSAAGGPSIAPRFGVIGRGAFGGSQYGYPPTYAPSNPPAQTASPFGAPATPRSIY